MGCYKVVINLRNGRTVRYITKIEPEICDNWVKIIERNGQKTTHNRDDILNITTNPTSCS